MAKVTNRMKWVIWALAATFYFYEYFLRVFPSVIIPDLMNVFSVDATAIGALSAFYFYIYAPLQLPVGMITDKYGARRLLAIAAFTAGLGTLLFGMANHYWIAAMGRFLMGFGSSFGFVGMIYICSHWFEESKRGIMIGFANTIGMMGAILGEGPLRIGINLFGWRVSLFVMAGFAFVLSGLIYLLVRNDPPEMKKFDQKTKKSSENLIKNLGIVTKNFYSWLNALVALFFFVTTASFAGLWGVPFIKTTYGISTELAGFAVSMIFFGWAAGGPLIGIFSDKIQQKKNLLLLANAMGFLLMSIVVYISNIPIAMLFILFFLIGFVSSGELLNFSYSIDINPQFAKGTAIAFTNFIVVIGAVVLQPLVGHILDLNWTGQMLGNVRVYPREAYTIAMSCFPASFLIAFILGFFLKKEKLA
ncbi:MAG: Membrane sensor protein UhpC [Chlamydiae bacterium]|nr:Membrane sensor protein UhpC [Chlamydiota bacterium]